MTELPISRQRNIIRAWIVVCLIFNLDATVRALARASGDDSYFTQYRGLEVFFNTTNGGRWLVHSGWRNTSLGICDWYGITCDSTGNVTGLSLAGNGLVGSLADAVEMSNISTLDHVDLSNNTLFGPVPLWLGEMSKLKVLDLSWNFFSSFPSTWGSGASSLQHLSLHFNNISGWGLTTGRHLSV